MSDVLIIVLVILSAPIWIPLGFLVGMILVGLAASIIGLAWALVFLIFGALIELFTSKPKAETKETTSA